MLMKVYIFIDVSLLIPSSSLNSILQSNIKQPIQHQAIYTPLPSNNTISHIYPTNHNSPPKITMSSTTQQPRLDRAYSTSSASSSDSNDGWLILNGHGSSTVTTPNESTDAFNPYLQLAPVTRGASTVNQKFRATENAEDRQRLFLLRARDN
ncbi:hypothetical protein BGAL_0300g00070 [Botrytis galanthina]|uniref:Uncharacterized protein n=1 Tax=Botrytis galanthina TaxID=278940 RepID=A0A4S8QTF0_9HELO|nr:hypothetical protein BGAL_0300g00070 [Botrytis galanthina]